MQIANLRQFSVYSVIGTVSFLPLLVLPAMVGVLVDEAALSESFAGWVVFGELLRFFSRRAPHGVSDASGRSAPDGDRRLGDCIRSRRDLCVSCSAHRGFPAHSLHHRVGKWCGSNRGPFRGRTPRRRRTRFWPGDHPAVHRRRTRVLHPARLLGRTGRHGDVPAVRGVRSTRACACETPARKGDRRVGRRGAKVPSEASCSPRPRCWRCSDTACSRRPTPHNTPTSEDSESHLRSRTTRSAQHSWSPRSRVSRGRLRSSWSENASERSARSRLASASRFSGSSY